MYTLARQESLTGMHSIAFLNHILHYDDRWLVIWDRSPIHRRDAVRQHVANLLGSESVLNSFPRTLLT